MSDKPEDVRITLRLPKDLHEWLNEVAAGDKRRPPASLNSTIIFVLRRAKELMESEPGNWTPELLEAVGI